MMTKQTQSEMMFPSEILPQSMVDMKKIVLKPKLDQREIQSISDEIKPKLFSRFGFGPKIKNIKLLCYEIFFEPYLIIGGKYSLDYCKKHLFEVDINQDVEKIFIAGQEFQTVTIDSKGTKKIVNIKGEEYVHYEAQTYLILDRMKREIFPEKLPIAPFCAYEQEPENEFHFKTMPICDQVQIDLLKAKIANRPTDVAEIIKEIFDITDRTLVYYPIYQLTFENTKSKTDATITINGVTGEVVLNGNRKLPVKNKILSGEISSALPEQAAFCEERQAKTIVKNKQIGIKDKIKNEEKPLNPAQPDSEETVCEDLEIPSDTKIDNVLPEYEIDYERKQTAKILKISQPDKVSKKRKKAHEKTQVPYANPEGEETIFGDLEIPSGTTINKTLVVKGALKIGNNCRVHGKLEALKGITVGADTIIDGDLISGGNIFLGPRSLVSGSVEAAGQFEIEENAIVEGICQK